MTIVRNRSTLAGEALEHVREVLTRFRHMDQVLRFSQHQSPGMTIADAINYEDGTRDVLAARHADGWVFSFTATQGGEILRATIWDRRPTPAELRAERDLVTLN